MGIWCMRRKEGEGEGVGGTTLITRTPILGYGEQILGLYLVSVYLCICMSVYLCICVSMYLCICASVEGGTDV